MEVEGFDQELSTISTAVIKSTSSQASPLSLSSLVFLGTL